MVKEEEAGFAMAGGRGTLEEAGKRNARINQNVCAISLPSPVCDGRQFEVVRA